MRPVLLICALVAALLAALAATTFLVRPPAVRAVNAPGQFDAARAKARLATILGDERPHPADSFGDDSVRSRLVGQIRAMGLNPIVRDQFACNTIYKQRGVVCARVRNIIVALGPASGKALLLNAHYDSTSVGPAAADDGVGVATLLEVASIMKSERLQRPLLFLFNEGEELGLVGARAFMADPLSKSVDSIVNLEARGTTGPVTMFETSLPNGPPVRAFANAVDRPFANSLTTDFYRQLPNYTDVNSFSERGWLTLNFAMIGNETRYHSPGDTVAALDPRSLQHMGDQTLAMARALSGGTPSGGGTLLFADIAGRTLVTLPEIAGMALLGLLTFTFAIVAFRRGGMGRGVALVVAGLVAALALAWLSMWLMGTIRPGSFWRAFPIWTQLATYACGITAGIAAILLIGRRLDAPELRTGYWLAFLLLGVAVLFVAKGGIVFFLLPPMVALLGIGLKRWLPWAEQAGAIAAALLLWLTVGEVIALLGDLMNEGPFPLFAPLAVIVVMPWLIEAKAMLDDAGPLRSIALCLLVTFAGWTAAYVAPAYSADRQQKFVIQYVADTGAKRAYWLVQNDRKPLPPNYGGVKGWRWEELPALKRKGWIADAPLLAVKPPSIQVVGETQSGSTRTVRFRIRSNGSDSVTLIADEDSGLAAAGTSAFVRPFAADATGRYFLTCFGRSCDGATLELTSGKPGPIELTLAGASRTLPASAEPLVKDRPTLARPQYTPDSAVTVATVRL